MSSTFLTILSVVAGILNSGLIQALIQAIEQIYKGSTGAEKKAVAMRMLLPLVPAGGDSIVSAAIDVQVLAFNEVGVFQHGSGSIGDSGAGPGPVTIIKGAHH